MIIRKAGMRDVYILEGSETERAWVVLLRTERQLHDWMYMHSSIDAQGIERHSFKHIDTRQYKTV